LLLLEKEEEEEGIGAAVAPTTIAELEEEAKPVAKDWLAETEAPAEGEEEAETTPVLATEEPEARGRAWPATALISERPARKDFIF
jgi:hypothetical protein